MEITINYYGQAVSVSVEVYEYLTQADHKTENLAHEQRRHWDGREFDEYIIATEGRLPYCATPEELICNCLLLDDGEECVCVQSISYSLICRWFRAAVLPLDESLCAALLHRENRRKCVLCGGWYIPKSNRAKYCPDCAGQEWRRKTRDRVRRHRAGM